MRDRIPSWHWAALVRAGLHTVEELALAAHNRRVEREAANKKVALPANDPSPSQEVAA